MTPENGLLSGLQAETQAKRLALLQSLENKPTGFEWCRRHAQVADELWRILWQEMVRLHPDCPPVSILATGGYGRQELSPASDIDVTLVPLYENSRLDAAVKWLFKAADQVVRDGLGLRMAYVYRMPTEVAGLDPVSLTNLLDMREVAGSPEPARNLEEALWAEFPAAQFVLDKIDERNRDEESTHSTPLVVEPNIKHGAGGLRSFHTANWIGQAVGQRSRPVTPQVDELLLVRNLLHHVSGRQNDVLTRQRREEVARLLRLHPLELGSRIAEVMDSIHEEYQEGLGRIRESRFSITSGARAVRGELRIDPGCSVTQAALAVDIATRLGLEIPPDHAPLDPVADPLIIASLTGGEPTVRNLDRSGVLQVMLPEFAHCKTLMPTDAAHVYTVYEHTLRAIRTLFEIPVESPFDPILKALKEPELLTLALLLHDTGKADPTRPHSEIGHETALDVCQRWGLDAQRTDTVAWLVLQHLTMSKFVRMRDVMHPDTVQEFATLVQDEQKLHLLTLLTYCDVSSVDSNLWTPVQQELLLTLHHRTLAVLQSHESLAADEDLVIQRMVKKRKDPKIPDEAYAAFLNSLPAHYVLSTDNATAQAHYELAENARQGEFQVLFRDDFRLGITEITVVCPDRPSSLTGILGVLYAYDIKIMGLRASTTDTDPPVLIDTFTVTSSGRPVAPRIAQSLQKAMVEILKGNSVDNLLRTHGKNPERKQEFIQLNVVDQDPAIIEVRAPRGRGLAYRLARVISGLGLNILAARLGQWAGSASAAFYVVDPTGQPVDPEGVTQAFLDSSDTTLGHDA